MQNNDYSWFVNYNNKFSDMIESKRKESCSEYEDKFLDLYVEVPNYFIWQKGCWGASARKLPAENI